MTPKPGNLLENAIAAAWPADQWRDSHVVLAVSGGADSVAMLRAVLALKERAGGRGQVVIAHLNHGLRGPEADADQVWLEQLCQRLEVPLTTGRSDVSTRAAVAGDGWEAAARTARYDFLRATAEQSGARYVAVAHTADDQVETVLHRILRGTGLTGLAGMSASRPLSASVTLVRPMLSVRHADVVKYLTELGQDYRTDSSNDDRRFTRNRLRNELLPLFREQFNSDVDTALLRLASQARETEQWIATCADELADTCVEIDKARDTAQIDCRPLLDQPPTLIREVCRIAWTRAGWPQQAVGFEEWSQLAELALALDNRPAITLPNEIRARRQGHMLLLTANRRFS